MITTKTGAKKLEANDNWAKIVPNAQGQDSAHNDSVEAHDDAIEALCQTISGTTNNSGHTINSGEYFIANGGKYKATATIPVNGAWSGSAQAVSDNDLINALNNSKANKSMAIQLTALSAGWSSGVQTISATGVTATNNIMVGAGSLTDAQFEEMTNAQIMCISQGTDSITLKHFGDTPTIDLPIVVIILG